MNDHRAATLRLPGRSGRRWGRCGLMVALLALSGGLILGAPLTLGTNWGELGRALEAVGPLWWPALTVVWLAGLCSYAAVMTASLPGLSGRQALGLNLAGSAVANSLPLGGGVSLALTTTMMRSWGFAPSAVTSFLLLTNVWNVVSRLLLGALAALWLLNLGTGGGVIGTKVLLVAAALVVAVLGLLTLLTSARVGVLTAQRRQIAAILRTSWLRLTVGMGGYFALLAVLLDLCLRGLGVPHSTPLILAAVGIERLVTALPITPGGAGAAELSLVACLTAAGISGVEALAATLLYRIFTFFAEIPLGAAVALAWHLRRDRPRIERAR